MNSFLDPSDMLFYNKHVFYTILTCFSSLSCFDLSLCYMHVFSAMNKLLCERRDLLNSRRISALVFVPFSARKACYT
jgi:hypothetical protein